MNSIFFLFFILFFSNHVVATPPDVVLAGFSINADYRDLDRSAYYTNKLLNKYNGKQNIIDQTLQKEIRSNTFNNINKNVKSNFCYAITNGLRYRPPPHGGGAFGIERIIMIITKLNSVKDTISFTMSTNYKDYVTNAPNKL